jgi:MYXO-CTERM domain-containing protein
MKRMLLKTLIFWGAMAGMSPQAKGSMVIWQSDFNALLYDSFGVALDTSFTFELGIFANGFVPTDSNLQDWESNWVVFDSAVFGLGWEPADQEFLSSALINADGSSTSPRATPGGVFNEGETFFLWAFNSKAYAQGSEWALVYDQFEFGNNGESWVVPEGGLGVGNMVELYLQSMDTAVVGGVNEVRGGGTPPTVDPGFFHLQTHAVPEPGGAMTLLLAGTLWGWRRQRGRKAA